MCPLGLKIIFYSLRSETFLFGRLLRLAGSRWKYSTPPPHGYALPLKVKVKVTLRLAVSQSVNLGVEPHVRLMTRYLLLFYSYGLVFCGALSLTRGRVSLLYILLALTSAVFLGSESLDSLPLLFTSRYIDSGRTSRKTRVKRQNACLLARYPPLGMAQTT
jgi:hypothetical protein